MRIVLILGLLLGSATAQAAVYKCVGKNGSLSYSQSPCPAETSQELLDLERSTPAGMGAAGNRYATMTELFERYRCDDIEAGFAVMPNRASMLNLIADLARQPGSSLRQVEALRKADPDFHARFVDGFVHLGEFCSLRLVNTPEELSINVGWHSERASGHRDWPIAALLQRLRELGYDMLAAEATSPSYFEGRFDAAGYSCRINVYNATVEAALEIGCMR
jgi:hypothetical protein